jgi:hypothetical protein
MRLASRPRPSRLPAHPGPDRTDGNAHARLRSTPAAPERPPAWSPSNVHAAVSASTMDATIGQVPDSACPAVSGRTPSPPPGTPAEPEAMRTGNTPSPLLWGRRLRLGNQGRLRDSNTASATVTTAVTRQLLGVAPRSKPRLGALLSSDDYGSSVERTAKLHPLWQCCTDGRHGRMGRDLSDGRWDARVRMDCSS